MTKSIESKLPEILKKDWLTYAADQGNAVNHQNHFDKLIVFLKSQESIYEQLDQLRDVCEPAKEKTKLLKYARTKTTKFRSETSETIVCGDPKHKKKQFFCRKFRTNLRPSERRDAAQQLGACKRCLEVHDGDHCRKSTYLCGNPECKDQHHYFLCTVARPQSQRTARSSPEKTGGRRCTETQEEFLSKLPAEAAVKVIKRALQNLGIGDGLTFSEFLTVLKLAANLANERPIDARVQSREYCIQYMTPNSLLLGRAMQSGDFKTFEYTTYPFKRLQEMQAQVSKFWKSWSQLAGPNLFIRSKWHTAERNVSIGDIVWLCDQNAIRGQFKLGRVVSVSPDPKGIVRDVHVKVAASGCVQGKTLNARELGPKENFQGTILHRDVRRLVVLIPAEDQPKGDQRS